jgi:FKBP-type peptidyl-prolyl cis-trans isomerase 2
VNPVFPARSKEDFVRKSVALIVAAGFVAVTAGCSAVPQASGCDPLITAGDASTVVTASGEFGSAPTVSFPTPLIAKTTQTTTLDNGTGDVLQAGQMVDLQLTVYLGSTGEELAKTAYSPTDPLRLTVGDDSTPLGESVQCQTVGSRTVTLLTAEKMFGPDGYTGDATVANDDTVVVVSDIDRGYLGRADGALQPLQAGFPAVVTAPDGTPGITLPNSDPPAGLEITNIRTGDGATVAEGDQVVSHFTAVIWNKEVEGVRADATVLSSTWEGKRAATLVAADASETEPEGSFPGLTKALVGQTVGSQVLAVIPPESGFPEGNTSVPEGASMVFVIDILGIQ